MNCISLGHMVNNNGLIYSGRFIYHMLAKKGKEIILC